MGGVISTINGSGGTVNLGSLLSTRREFTMVVRVVKSADLLDWKSLDGRGNIFLE